MAWTTPREWVTGETVTKTILDAFVRDNQLALHTGASGIASLAANDVIVASSSSQLTRQASLNVAQGGTGATTHTSGSILLGAGTSAITSTATLAVAKGGTGATSLTDGGLLLGSGTAAITALGAASNGQIPIGDGTTDPQLANITGTSNEIEITNGSASIQVGIVTNPTLAGANFSAIPAGTLSSGTVATARLGSGTASSGTFLRGDQAWAEAGGGMMLQVVGTTYTTQTARESSTFAATGLTQAITLADDSNKVIVLCQTGGVGKDASNTKCQVRLYRAIDGGATTLIGTEPNAGYNALTSANNVGSGAVWNILDSPATAAAITYYCEFASQNDAAVVYVQLSGATSSLTLIEVDA